MAVGDWPEAMRLQWAITKREMIESWMLGKFLTDGLLWGDRLQQDVANWPSDAIICQCVGVSRGVIGDVIETGGAVNVKQVCKRTSACSVCGSCKPLISQLLGVKPDSVRFQMLLLISAFMAAIWGFWSFFGDKVPFVDTVDVAWRWDLLWTDGIVKQITGYLILGIAVLVAGLSLRKRVKKLHSVGKFEVWRVIHVVISIGLIAMMIAHTGLRMGDGMNFWLTSSFAVMVLAGVILTIVIGMEHHLKPMRARVLRRKANWLHLMAIWPLPVLLAFHIIKIYYY
jgi:nitrite reductase (NADH) large subunit